MPAAGETFESIGFFRAFLFHDSHGICPLNEQKRVLKTRARKPDSYGEKNKGMESILPLIRSYGSFFPFSNLFHTILAI